MDNKNRPRKSWISAVLTIGMPGLGHIYCGQLKNGLLFYSLVILVNATAFSTYLIRSFFPFNIILSLLFLPVIDVVLIINLISHIKSLGGEYHLQQFNRWYVYLAVWSLSTFVVLPLVKVTLNAILIETFTVPSSAMENTIFTGDWIIADKLKSSAINPEERNVVVFNYPHNPKDKSVKRLIAGPGQTVEIREREIYVDGRHIRDPEDVKFLNNNPQPKDWIDPNIFPRGNGNKDHYQLIRVPAKGDTLSAIHDRATLWYVAIMDGHSVRLDNEQIVIDDEPVGYYIPEQDYYFMMGDNRDQSFDSRFWGFVPHEYILGKALYVYWSRDPESQSVRSERIGKVIR